MIEFTLDFKKKCFSVFKIDKDIVSLMDYLDKNNYTIVRIIMEEAIDRLTKSLNTKLIEGDHIVHNAKIDTLASMKELEAELEQIYENTNIEEAEAIDRKR